METVLPFSMILNVALNGVSEFDTSLMTRPLKRAIKVVRSSSAAAHYSYATSVMLSG
jgi:hypothetical protein